MKKMFPVFRAGRYLQAKGLVTDGKLTNDHIQQIAENTTRILNETSFRPAIKFGHVDNGEAAGWVTGVESKGPVLFAELDVNDLGREAIKGKRRRFVSAEIAKKFSLTGDEDGEHVGLSLKGVALLGAEEPQIKTLCDLAESDFAEAEGSRIVREMVTAEGDHISYFAEVEFTTDPEDTRRREMDEAKFKEVEAQLSEERAKREAAEKRIATIEQEKKEAELKSKKEAVAVFCDQQTTEKRFGKSSREKFIALFQHDAIVSDDELVKMLREAVESLPKLGANFADMPHLEDVEDNSITAADFKEAAMNPKKSRAISNEFNRRKAANPSLSYDQFQASFVQK